LLQIGDSKGIKTSVMNLTNFNIKIKYSLCKKTPRNTLNNFLITLLNLHSI